MNPKLEEINNLLTLCDQMLTYIQERGDIRPNNELYLSYRNIVKRFCKETGINEEQYGPYAILCAFYFRDSYTVNASEVSAIKDTLIKIKHTLFKDDYEKIFISHREKDKEQVAALINLLHALGIPRETVGSTVKPIFCSSHPEGYISNGDRNLDTIRNMLNTDEHVFYILWYTDNYFESQACLNEAGAIWALDKKRQEILMPSFDSNKIQGLMDKQLVWFRANDKARLNTFKAQIEQMFGLPQITPNAWEIARDMFIEKIVELNNSKNG